MKATTPRIGIENCAWLAVALLIAGCDGRDARLERVVDQSLEQQAAQNHDMARLHQDLTDGTKRLVEADAQARQELVTMQHELRGDQAAVGAQRDLLELDRKTLAAERQRDQLLAVVLQDFGLLMVCVAPLLLAGYAIFVATRTPADEGLCEVLIQEITSAEPLLLPAREPPQLPAATAGEPLSPPPAQGLQS